MYQQTIRNIIEFSGVALHSGVNVNVRIKPAKAGRGIVFVRTDLADSINGAPVIAASASNVVSTGYATTLADSKTGATVATIEHLMAAFYGLSIDNAIVELNGPEIPIMDGSAVLFADLIETAGIKKLSEKRRYIVIDEPISVIDGDKSIEILPTHNRDFIIDYSIDFNHAVLGPQTFAGSFSRKMFLNDVVKARTFGFLKDIEMLRANGLAKGGSLENAVVIGDDDVLNTEGLRYPDECVRHKVLDAIGDLALVGYPILGHLIACKSGHGLNHKLAEAILANTGSWHFETREALQSDYPIMPVIGLKEAVSA